MNQMGVMDDLQVLYVDDEPDIREVAVLSLELDPGIKLRAVESGQAALELLADGRWTPNVILLDVMMPGMDGPGVLANIRAMPAHAETPVIFITASVQAEERARLLALGAIGVIAKPFDPMSLAAQFRAVIAVAADGR
jgi:CheY-like chemotaxis protein